MQTLYRKLLHVLPRLGVRVFDLAPGLAVVSRRGSRYAVTRVNARTWVVGRERTSTVPLGDPGARLLFPGGEASVADERRFQLAAAKYLCAHHVTALLDRYEVNCVFDVGANAGQYARELRRFGYTGRIVSFEPVKEAFAMLEEAAAEDPDWRVHPFALGREDETRTIHAGWNTMNSLLPPSDYGRDRYRRFAKARDEEIELRRLDGVMEQALEGIAAPRPFLKMDTQGFDLEVFAGAGKRAGDFVGLQSEIALLRLYEGSPRMGEAVAAYEDSGFEITGMYPVTREASTGRVVEFDCVMVRADAAPAPADA